jgi:putative proteasome-type protease
MTYCLAIISVDAGLVFCSDSRTNAGIDQVSTYSKMYSFCVEGERSFVVLSAGNLATTQGVIAKIKRDIRDNANPNLLSVTTMVDAADYLGDLSHAQQQKHTDGSAIFEASFILGGQIGGDRHEIHLIYPAGNHITTSKDTPYLQIGESKYGKPILDRILTPTTSLETASLAALVSMDSTMRSNLTVGPPIELMLYEKDSLQLNRHQRFDARNEYLKQLSSSWENKLSQAFNELPPLAWPAPSDESADQ